MMPDALWIAKKLALQSLIRQVSRKYGGDDKEWLDQYINDVINENKSDLSSAIDCFNDLLAGIK